MSLMERLNIEEVNWREGESQLQLKRPSPSTPSTLQDDAAWSHRPVSPLPAGAHPLSAGSSKRQDFQALSSREPLGGGAPDAQRDPAQIVHSPMVGTLYLTPAPDSPPFVNVGDTVSEDSVLCVIEAMKVMNEIRAPNSGKIAEIFMESGSPVECGSHLMRIA